MDRGEYPGSSGIEALRGTNSVAMHIPGGIAAAAVFNSQPLDYPAFLAETDQILLEFAV